MKKKVLVLAALAIAIAIAATGTLAYFTATGTARNVITSGGIDIALIEKADTGNGLADFENVDGVMPGAELSKIVTVQNTGASDAWVRVSVTKSITLASGVQGTPDLSLVVLDINNKDWTEQDGFYYYNSALKPGETTKPLFTTVTFAPQMGNEYQGSTANIDVQADAVQVANNGTSALTATGWPA